jgi:ribosomal protein S18 acetylase RimI-like enzyme
LNLSPIEFQGQSKEIEAFLADRIYEFNSSTTGLFDGEEFAATVKDACGRIIAGVSGHTWGGCCQVSQLWVHESAREHGVGKSLMLAVETHALSRHCTQIILSSHTFQAPEFYRKLGFVEHARISGYPRGHSDIHFTKFLPGAKRDAQAKSPP